MTRKTDSLTFEQWQEWQREQWRKWKRAERARRGPQKYADLSEEEKADVRDRTRRYYYRKIGKAVPNEKRKYEKKKRGERSSSASGTGVQPNSTI